MDFLDRFFDVTTGSGELLSCEIKECRLMCGSVAAVTVRFCNLNRYETGYVKIDEWTPIKSIREKVAENYVTGNYKHNG